MKWTFFFFDRSDIRRILTTAESGVLDRFDGLLVRTTTTDMTQNKNWQRFTIRCYWVTERFPGQGWSGKNLSKESRAFNESNLMAKRHDAYSTGDNYYYDAEESVIVPRRFTRYSPPEIARISIWRRIYKPKGSRIIQHGRECRISVKQPTLNLNKPYDQNQS